MTRAERLAEAFGLGAVRQPLALAAKGWGGHNEVFRLETEGGAWAVKRHGRPGLSPPDAGFAIETAACGGGVPMARPVATVDGHCWAEVDGASFRCHEWIDGTAKDNEDTSAGEAEAMGRIVAHLHGLAIPAVPAVEPDPPTGPDLAALLKAGSARGATWAPRLAEQFAVIDAMAAQPRPVQLGRGELVGSHRDLNAHNVLFSPGRLVGKPSFGGRPPIWRPSNDAKVLVRGRSTASARSADRESDQPPGGLRLVDWDGAGPAWPRWERVDFAVRWATRHDGSYDETVLDAFVRGYRDGGGEWDADDPSVLAVAPGALLPWVVQNLEMAVNQPTAEQDELAAVMVEALLATPAGVAQRQVALRRCLNRVLSP